jgi:hypothetical protein
MPVVVTLSVIVEPGTMPKGFEEVEQISDFISPALANKNI